MLQGICRVGEQRPGQELLAVVDTEDSLKSSGPELVKPAGVGEQERGTVATEVVDGERGAVGN